MNRPIPRADLERFNAALAEKRRRIAKVEHQTRGYRDEDGVWQGGLLSFVRYFWHVLEPGTPFVDGWVLEAICEHLEAVTYGEITNLLINVFPGAMKSLLTNVFWPAWEWGAMDLAHLRYVTFSYSSSNTERDNQRFGDLVSSPDYQAMYPHVAIRQNGMTMVSNRKHGWKLASSVTGSVTGKRGNRAICDDLNNVKESESKAVMDETNRWFRESLSSRLNNMETDAKIVISQRVGEADVSGEILRLNLPYTHLCIPMEFVWQADENGDPYTTSIGWVDPRWRPNQEDCEGELAWSERFSERSVQSLKIELGPFATASQLQQTPEARGGGLIKREWWMPAEVYMTNDGQKFPPFEYIVASLDGAYTEEEKNDPSALVILGVFQNEHGYNRAMLVHAWEKRLEFSGPRMDVDPNEHESMYRRRCMPHWGLIEWVADTCKRFKADKLLIESKASGISAAQSLRNSHGREGWTIQLVEPKGDKYARVLAVQASFSQEMIYAPDREWATRVIDNMAIFPYGAHDDLCFAAGTMIATLRGNVPIENIRLEDKVLTPIGWHKVTATGMTGMRSIIERHGLLATPNHPIFTFDFGFVAIDSTTQATKLSKVNLCDMMNTARRMRSNLTGSFIEGWAEREDIISRNHPEMLDAKKQKGFMSRSGNITTPVWFQKATMFIISITILSISSLLILSVYRWACIEGCLKRMVLSAYANTSKILGRWQRRGTDPRKAENGTGSMLSKVCISLERFLITTPLLVGGTALSVERSTILETAAEYFVRRFVKMSTPIGKRRTEDMQPVYNLTVEGAHCYYANGILVHNCDAMTQAIKHLRDTGLIRSDEERRAQELDAVRHRGAPKKPMYPGFSRRSA